MVFNLSLFENKIEFFEAYSLLELEKKIASQVENNQALLLEPYQVSHQTVYHPELQKIIYSAVVHFKLNKKSS